MIQKFKYIALISYLIFFLNSTPNKILSQENYNQHMLALVNGFKNSSKELTEKIIALSDKEPIYNFNRTSLMLASFNGHTSIVKKLIEYKADTKHIDDFGDTALIHASWQGHLEICKILIENGADKDHKNMRKDNFLDIARRYNHMHIVKYFQDKQ